MCGCTCVCTRHAHSRQVWGSGAGPTGPRSQGVAPVVPAVAVLVVGEPVVVLVGLDVVGVVGVDVGLDDVVVDVVVRVEVFVVVMVVLRVVVVVDRDVALVVDAVVVVVLERRFVAVVVLAREGNVTSVALDSTASIVLVEPVEPATTLATGVVGTLIELASSMRATTKVPPPARASPASATSVGSLTRMGRGARCDPM